MVTSLVDQAVKLRVTALGIVQHSLNFAREELRRQLLSGVVNPLASQADKEQDGFEPTEIDAAMDKLIGALVASTVPGSTYVSEENNKNYYPHEGEIFAWCDPLDGTTNSFTVFADYAVVLYFDVFRHGRFEHLAGAVGAADGTIVSWRSFAAGGEVWIDWPSDFAWPSIKDRLKMPDGKYHRHSVPRSVPYSAQIVRPQPGRDRSGEGWLTLNKGLKRRMAAVASTPERRAEILNLFDLDQNLKGGPKREQLWLSTLGGNPLLGSLLVGDLGAIIEPHAVKLHDAIYLVPLLLTGGYVVDFDGNDLAVKELFSEPVRDRRKIGPFVAAASREAVDEILARRQ